MKTKKFLYALMAAITVSSVCMATACGDSELSNLTPGEERVLTDTTTSIAEYGTTGYKVVIPTDASSSEKWAANELVTFIQRSTGATLPVVAENTVGTLTTQDKIISVGDTQMLVDTGITVTQAEVTTDGYKIIRKDNTVYICGPTDWGTTFGVFEFLHHQVGYEPYTADEIYYEEHEVLKLKDFGTYVDVPAFETRYMDGIANYDLSTSYRLRTVSVYAGQENFGGTKRKNWIPGSDHTIQMILPEGEYGHFYNPSTQICLTSQEVIDAVILNLKRLILENPDGYIINIGQEDGKDFHGCPACQGEIQKYTVSGYNVRFMNKIINALETWKNNGGDNGEHPELKDRYLIYSTFAYGESLTPPVIRNANGTYTPIDSSVVPHPKLYIKIASNACPVHAMDDETCENNSRLIKGYYGWSAICPRLFFWNYGANYQCYLPLYNDFDRIHSEYKMFEELGVIDMFTEMNSGGSITMFGWLRMYLRAKCMWNTNQDVEQLIKNFMKAYFKDVEPIMTELLNLYRTHQRSLDLRLKAQGKIGLHSMEMNTDLWPRSIVDQAETLINQALAVCDAMSDQNVASKLRMRVEEELVCLQLVQVQYYQEYGYDMTKYDAFVAAFEQKTIEMNISKYREHESMADWLAGKKR